jgi:hypothetical protein
MKVIVRHKIFLTLIEKLISIAVRNCKRHLSDDDSDATPRNSKRRKIETRQSGACIILGDSGSTRSGSEHGGTESGEETARNDDNDSQVKTLSREETVVRDMVDQNSGHGGGASQDEITSLHEAGRNSTYNETKRLDEKPTHNDNTQHNQSAAHNITAQGGEIEELPVLGQTKSSKL